MDDQQKHSMKVVARRTGLTPHAIRVWEKRYGAVTPMRTATKRRLYSDAEIERLRLLRQATLAGHSIGQIAHLPTDRLLTLVAAEEEAVRPPHRRGAPGSSASVPPLLNAAVAAIERFDAEGLEAVLRRASVECSLPVLLEQVIAPLMERIGELWQEGVLRVAHEHLASAVIRTSLELLRGTSLVPPSAPGLIATTPAGQMHEIGALMAAMTAASDGWRVAYLGPNLPAVDIAAAAQHHQTRAVALSIVYPPDDPYLGAELVSLCRLLPEGLTILVGGRAAQGYTEALETIGAVRLHTLSSLRSTLQSLRSPQGPQASPC
jgi:MerR family transcriptional regulator, light-induced transcriptional regulator